jgi:hypothetical protein
MNKIRDLVCCVAMASVPWLRGTIRLGTFVLSIVLVAIPGFAAHRPPGPYHIWKDPAAKEYSHDGLPCSTAAIPGSPASRSGSSLLQLDQIERQTMTAIRSTGERGNSRSASLYRPAVIRGSEKQPAINFSYHSPRADRNPARGR